MLNGPKSEKLKGVCDIFDLSNIVKDPTCFTSRNKPLLLDVIYHSLLQRFIHVWNRFRYAFLKFWGAKLSVTDVVVLV